MNPLQTSLILPPALETYDRSTVINFLKEWNIYSSRVKRFNDATTPDRKLASVPLRECIDRSIVYTIVTFDLELSEEINEDNVEDKILVDHLNSFAGTTWSSAIDVAELFKPLRFNHYEDPVQSVHEIFSASRSILSSHGLVKRFDDKSELREEQITAIVHALHPTSLRDSISKSLSLDRIECKDNLRLFYKFLLETLKSFRLFNPVSSTAENRPVSAERPQFRCFFCQGPHHIRQCADCTPAEASRLLTEYRNRKPHIVTGQGSHSANSSNRPTGNNIPKPTTFNPNYRSNPPASSSGANRSVSFRTPPKHFSSSPTSAFRPPTPVSNPSNATSSSSNPGPTSQPENSNHIRRMTDFDMVDKEFWSRPLTPSSSPEISNHRGDSSLNDEEPVPLSLSSTSRVIDSVQILVGNKEFLFSSVVDDGADVTIVGTNSWNQIAPSDPEIRHSRHRFVLGDGSVRASNFAFLADIVILTSAGPVTVRRHWVHVLDCDMPEVLLGRPLLLCLGIDIDFLLLRLGEQRIDITDNYHVTDDHDMLKESEFEDVPRLGSLHQDDIDSALKSAVNDALAEGAPESFIGVLSVLLTDYRDIFRVQLGPDPPVDIDPVRIELLESAVPFLCKPRRSPPLHSKFLLDHFQQLIEFGYVYPNPQSEWASPVFCVPKSGVNRTLRSVVDLRYPNSQIKKLVWPMPHLHAVGEFLADSVVFATLDAFKGFWQFPISGEVDSQSMMTPLGIVTPRRLPQGNTNSVFIFQQGMEAIFRGTLGQQQLLIWIDDLLAHATDHESLLSVLETIFSLCRHFKLKLNASRCRFYLLEAKYCGKLYSKNGVRHDPSRIDALVEMPTPHTAADLMQFLCASTWVSSHIPDFERFVRPLRDLLEYLLQGASKRSKAVARRISISPVHWSDDVDVAFRATLKALGNSVTLAHPTDGYDRCLFTDASGESYSIIITQVHPDELSKPIESQNHEPLAFFSRSFRGSSARWAIPEKEAFPILDAIHRFDYLLIYERKFRIFTDHKNLMFIFNPDKTSIPLKQHTLDKLYRWALKLSSVDYLIEHIPGQLNIWADMLSRWAASDSVPKRICHLRRQRKFSVGLVSPLNHDFIWPTLDEISKIQHAARPSDVSFSCRSMTFDVNDEGVFCNDTGRIWIPTEAVELQLRLIIIAHCGSAGHRGQHATLMPLESRFFWENMRSDVDEFLRQCLHCLPAKGGDVVLRPFGSTAQPSRANEIIDFDYLYIGKSFCSFKYLLVIRDRLSGFIDIFPADEPTAAHTAENLLEWFSRYGIVKIWVTDRGTHFVNRIIEDLSLKLHANHHFHLAYCPWTHAGVETANAQILRVFRSLVSEYRLSFKDWPMIIPLVRYILNNSVSPSLQFAPITLFTGREPSSALDVVWDPVRKVNLRPNCSSEELVEHVVSLRQSLANMHLEVTEIREETRLRTNRRRKAPVANFTVGDFVLYAIPQQHRESKLAFKWHGPGRIVDVVSDYVFVVQNLVTQATFESHAQRLRFYSDQDLNVTTDLLNQIAHDDNGLEVHEVVDAKVDKKGKWSLKIRWRGFTEDFDSWESLSHLLNECGIHVRRLIHQSKIPSVVNLAVVLRETSPSEEE